MIEQIEEAVLGTCITNPLDSLLAFESLKPEHFYLRSHEIVFKALLNRFRKGLFIDVNTIIKEIRSSGDMAELPNGKMFIANLCNLNFKTIDIASNVKAILEENMRRQLMLIGYKISNKCQSEVNDPFEIISECNKQINELINDIPANNIFDLRYIKDVVIYELKLALGKDTTFGIPTGISRLDRQINGWNKSDLVIVAGRPGMGKSTVAMNFASSAILNGNPVAFFSLEMSKEQLVGRLMSIFSDVNSQDIIMKRLTEWQIKHLELTTEGLNGLKLWIDESAGLNVFEFKSKVRKLVREKGIQLVIIDYLQLMEADDKRKSREQQISEISRNLKMIAKELQITIIALSQMSRDIEKRVDKKPQLSDLRESGAIEQDADMVIFCYRPDMMGMQDYEINGRNVSASDLFILDIKKFRNGQPGEIITQIIPSLTKIVNYDY